ncbi:hypothetical protein ACWGQT_00860 [Streptomyces yangpuensis]
MWLDRFPAAIRVQAAAGPDANIPHFVVGETRTVRAWDVTVQVGAFIAIVIAPLIMITGAWQAPAAVGLCGMVFMAVRRSHLRYQRIRLS